MTSIGNTTYDDCVDKINGMSINSTVSNINDKSIDILTAGLHTMNLAAMTEPDTCEVIWHYAELSISPESFTQNIDWTNEVIRLKPGQTSVFLNFTYFTGFKRKIQLNEIMHIKSYMAGSAGLPRIEILKEWAASDLGMSLIFKDTEIQGLMLGNYIAVPIMDSATEIHMCIIGLIRHKIGFMLRASGTPTQRFTMFVDLANGLQNRLSITGTVQAIGCNIFKAIFEVLKKRPIIDYLDLVACMPPIPFIQMVYNIKAYFPELQVVWSTEHNAIIRKNLVDINTAPIDQVSHKFGRPEKLKQLQDKWLSRRQNSVLFKSLVGAVQGHSSAPAKPGASSGKGKEPTRFSALWPEVMDVLAD